MISILILLILAWSFYIGYSRGLVLQVYYTISSFVAMVIAAQFYQEIAQKINLLVPYASAQEGAVTYFFSNNQLFQLDRVFYAGLAYLLIYTIVYAVARFIGIFVHLFPLKQFTERWQNLVSGALSVFVTLFVVLMVLTILATIPLSLVQNQLNASGVARFLIQHTPFLSGFLRSIWVTAIIG